MTRAAIVTICASFATSLALAQDISGNWLATLTSARLGRLERIRVMLSKNRARDLIGAMYVSYNAAILPGHSAVTAYPCRSVSLIGSQLNLVMKREGMPGDVMAFQGIVSEDGYSIVGWLQGLGHNDRLKLERSGRAHNSKAPPEKSAAPAPTPPEPAPEAAMLKPALTPAPTAESSALLARALEKLSGTNLRLLKYTCLETIDRSYYSEPTWERGTDVMTEPPSCKQREFGKERQLILNAQDRLRLEVAVADHREIDSWASVGRFDSRSIDDLVLTGPTSTGGFGTGLIGIFENSGVQYTFLGKKTEGSRQVFEYAFDVPVPLRNQ